MRKVSVFLLAMMLAAGAMAEDWDVHRPVGASRPTGLSASINVGMLIANKEQAFFYSGHPDNENTIDRILHSEGYGNEIWSNLVNQQLISPSAIQNYGQLEVVEYGLMSYKLTYQIGLGVRYDLPSGVGFLLRFDYSRLTATGAFNLSSTNGAGILSDQTQYVQCPIGGVENRINIDIAYAQRFYLSESTALEFDLGFNLNNLKVKESAMEIAGVSYSILDIWGGQSPMLNSGTYEYVNQGGIGYGGFATAAFCYILPGENSLGTIDLGYTFYYTKQNLKHYWSPKGRMIESGLFTPQHAIFLRFNLNNFHFFDK